MMGSEEDNHIDFRFRGDGKMKRRWIRLVTAVEAAVLAAGMPVRAGDQEDLLPVRDYTGNYCYVEHSGSDTIRGAQLAGLCEVDRVYKDVGNLAYLNLGVGTFSNGMYGLVLKRSDYAALLALHGRCQRWLSDHLPKIVPEGTPWKEALGLCADWIADNMVYDRDALRDPVRTRAYQSAVSCFFGGTGICATYATAFDSMVHYLPIDPDTALVSWRAEDPVHLETKYVGNDAHLWSAVWEEDGWHFYDITFYDNDGGARRPEYLDMGEAALCDGFHDVIDTYFSADEQVFAVPLPQM